VPTLEVLPSQEKPSEKPGEVFACAFTQDGALALTGGWDGHLRLWQSDSGRQVAAFPAASKPLSACAISPDGKNWLSGSMDGVLSVWDPVSHLQTSQCLAHTRPVAAITFAPDGQTVGTAGWDRKLSLRATATIREGQTLNGHSDLVAGCRFLPDSIHFMSWSHDGSVRVWDISTGSEVAALPGHNDRVNSAAVSPDGKWIVSATRDKEIKLWEWRDQREVKTITVNAEPRGVFYLPDGASIVSVDAEGWLTLFSAPDLETQEEIETGLPVQCAELAPVGTVIALGCTDGRVRFVSVGGVESAPILATATPMTKKSNSAFSFLLGKNRVRRTFNCTCPACQQSFELSDDLPEQPKPCPHCRRRLRFSSNAPVAVGQKE
jgi:WD40 repeat protein